MIDNLILKADSYKYSHYKQYPSNITYMNSYLESRGGAYGVTKFFGLQYYLMEYLTKQVTKKDVIQAQEVITMHGLFFDYDGWMKIVNKHNGYLPIRIRAVIEGSIIPNNNVLVTIESTDSEVAWIVGFVETLILKIWYPITVATFSNQIKKIIKENMLETSDTLDKLPFMLHDFGYRGASSEESALLGGMAHLTNFMGSDTIASIVGAKLYYQEEMAAFSIPASEHSTITAWGKENEYQAYKNMIDQFKDCDLFACVSDSWNFFNAVDNVWGKELIEDIQKMNATLVIRPDSGDSITNILYALHSLEERFGITVNTKGYKVLNNVALIQGDGISEDAVYDILKAMKACGYSADNIAFGVGGALLQGNDVSSINRDTHRFAIKCSAIKIGDTLREVYKSPITDHGKVSKRGRLDLIKTKKGYETVVINDLELGNYHKDSVLQTVFENGKLTKSYSLNEIRNKGE